jgi:osmotically-inducible protein OsmY
MKPLYRIASAIFLAIVLATAYGCAATATKESTGEYIDDAAITTKVKAAIFDRPTLKMFDIHVETFKGVVRLSGTVSSRATIEEAGKVARSVAGVESVKNGLQLM